MNYETLPDCPICESPKIEVKAAENIEAIVWCMDCAMTVPMRPWLEFTKRVGKKNDHT
jgi:hypothetical protein